MNDVTANELLNLLVLALPVAAISWTITHEELFREPGGSEASGPQVLLFPHL